MEDFGRDGNTVSPTSVDFEKGQSWHVCVILPGIWRAGVGARSPPRVMQECMHERACMSACTHDDEDGKHLTLT